MSEMLSKRLRWGGGSYFFGGGFAKRGVRPNPPNPLWLRACIGSSRDQSTGKIYAQLDWLDWQKSVYLIRQCLSQDLDFFKKRSY